MGEIVAAIFMSERVINYPLAQLFREVPKNAAHLMNRRMQALREVL